MGDAPIRGRPTAEPDNSYAPMARRPQRLECGSPVHYGHLDPPCCLVGWLLHESQMEALQQLHSTAVPSDVVPIPPPARLVDGFYVPANEGPKMMVTDSGELGGRPWAALMNRRMDIAYFEGEWGTSEDRDRPLGKALLGLRRYCSGRHSSWIEHRGQPVCWQLVRLIIMGRYSVFDAAEKANMTPERAAWLLHRWEGSADKGGWTGSVDKLWTWVANDLNGIIGVRRRRDPAA